MQKYFAKSPIFFIHFLRRIMQSILYLVSYAAANDTVLFERKSLTSIDFAFFKYMNKLRSGSNNVSFHICRIYYYYFIYVISRLPLRRITHFLVAG